ncbi:hypothetical protein [Nocardioides sp. SYSU D00038]|nr:hypothetical protein [Nocardioides sp. SYSU D00038]
MARHSTTHPQERWTRRRARRPRDRWTRQESTTVVAAVGFATGAPRAL